MIKWLLNKVKYMVAFDELGKLQRYETLTRAHRAWLSEFPDIVLVLENIQQQVHGKDFNGQEIIVYSDISNLREKLRTSSSKIISKEGIYSCFIDVENKIKSIVDKLTNQTKTQERNKSFVELNSCIPFKASCTLKDIFINGPVQENFFFSEHNKTLLINLKLINKDLNNYACTKLGQEFIIANMQHNSNVI